MGVVRHFKRFGATVLLPFPQCQCVYPRLCGKKPAEGTWVVTEAHQPGISAVSPQQAQTILGRSLQYKSDRATLNQQQCITPRYHEQQFHLDDFSQCIAWMLNHLALSRQSDTSHHRLRTGRKRYR